MAPKIRRTMYAGLFAVINPGITRDGREIGLSIRRIQWESPIGPRGLRFSEPIERKITNHDVQSGRF